MLDASTSESYQETHVVAASDTARAFGSDFQPAASTPYVLGLAEVAAHRSVSGSLADGQTTVGTRSVIDHLSPSPIGVELVVKSTLVGADGPKLKFEIGIYDGTDLVATIEHHRAIVNTSRISERLEKRKHQRG